MAKSANRDHGAVLGPATDIWPRTPELLLATGTLRTVAWDHVSDCRTVGCRSSKHWMSKRRPPWKSSCVTHWNSSTPKTVPSDPSGCLRIFLRASPRNFAVNLSSDHRKANSTTERPGNGLPVSSVLSCCLLELSVI